MVRGDVEHDWLVFVSNWHVVATVLVVVIDSVADFDEEDSVGVWISTILFRATGADGDDNGDDEQSLSDVSEVKKRRKREPNLAIIVFQTIHE